MLFCPTCANLLMVEEAPSYGLRYACNTCPYIYSIKNKMSTRTYPKLKVSTIVFKIASDIQLFTASSWNVALFCRNLIILWAVLPLGRTWILLTRCALNVVTAEHISCNYRLGLLMNLWLLSTDVATINVLIIGVINYFQNPLYLC